jgi:hypothetical protein
MIELANRSAKDSRLTFTHGVAERLPYRDDAIDLVISTSSFVLERAAFTAPRMIIATRLLGRADDRHRYYPDRQYVHAWAGATAEFMQASYLDVDQRATFFQVT